eukprot:5568341-Pleurochrysis_carterae.AAC.1
MYSERQPSAWDAMQQIAGVAGCTSERKSSVDTPQRTLGVDTDLPSLIQRRTRLRSARTRYRDAGSQVVLAKSSSRWKIGRDELIEPSQARQALITNGKGKIGSAAKLLAEKTHLALRLPVRERAVKHVRSHAWRMFTGTRRNESIRGPARAPAIEEKIHGRW